MNKSHKSTQFSCFLANLILCCVWFPFFESPHQSALNYPNKRYLKVFFFFSSLYILLDFGLFCGGFAASLCSYIQNKWINLKVKAESCLEIMYGLTWSVYQGQSTGLRAGGTGIWRGTWAPVAENDPQVVSPIYLRQSLIRPRPPSWSPESQTGGRAEPSKR